MSLFGLDCSQEGTNHGTSIERRRLPILSVAIVFAVYLLVANKGRRKELADLREQVAMLTAQSIMVDSHLSPAP